MPPRIKVEVGNKYGRLTVQKETEINKIGKVYSRRFEVACECGNVLIVSLQALRSGNTSSCGCLHRERTSLACRTSFLIGKRFGRLKLLGESKHSSPRRRKLELICDCGTTVDVLADSLVSGKTQSCGCLMRELASNRRILEGESIPIGRMFGKLKVTSNYELKIQKTGERKGRGTSAYECVCVCGKKLYVSRGSLLSVGQKSCLQCSLWMRPSKSVPLKVGEVFGMWVVYEDEPPHTPLREKFVSCRCSCGTLSQVLRKNLVGGTTNSCGHWYNKSKGEDELYSFLTQELGILEEHVTRNDRKALGGKEIDLLIQIPQATNFTTAR